MQRFNIVNKLKNIKLKLFDRRSVKTSTEMRSIYFFLINHTNNDYKIIISKIVYTLFCVHKYDNFVGYLPRASAL